MFNVGPLELLVLAIVGVVVIGPDRLPNLARQAAELIRTLRELANGARTQLRDELGPEFADVDLRNLNPRTAVRRALFGDDDFADLRALDPRNAVRGALFGDDRADDGRAATSAVSMTKDPPAKPVARANVGERPRPRPRPSRPADEPRGYDDAT